jgi:hypothetical protein
VKEWLATAAGVPGFVGFAVGRTVFWPPMMRWRPVRHAGSRAGEVKVNFDAKTDFAKFKTWTWREGTLAPNPTSNNRLREAIEKQLETRGLRRLEQGGDLAVVYHAAGETQISVEKLDYKAPGFVTEGSKVQAVRAGTVLADIINSSTGEVVWRGEATGASDPSAAAVERGINEAVEKLFKDFPPGR